MDAEYIASLLNSTLRMTTPILFATLGSAICSRVKVFNIALEGQMLAATFFTILVNYFTRNVLLSVAAGLIAGTLLGFIVSIFQVKLKANALVVGISINILVASGTSYMLYTFFGIRGTLQGNGMVSLDKINFEFLSGSEFLSRTFENLTILDYLSYFIAIVIFIYLFKTVSGFRWRSVGINKVATESLGTKADRIQIIATVLSGTLCGLGGVALCMGNVTMFTESMTSGRGFVALAAAMLGQSNPLACIAAALFFGMAMALSRSMQNVINSQLTMTFPYLVTILTMALYGIRYMIKKKNK